MYLSFEQSRTFRRNQPTSCLLLQVFVVAFYATVPSGAVACSDGKENGQFQILAAEYWIALYLATGVTFFISFNFLVC